MQDTNKGKTFFLCVETQTVCHSPPERGGIRGPFYANRTPPRTKRKPMSTHLSSIVDRNLLCNEWPKFNSGLLNVDDNYELMYKLTRTVTNDMYMSIKELFSFEATNGYNTSLFVDRHILHTFCTLQSSELRNRKRVEGISISI